MKLAQKAFRDLKQVRLQFLLFPSSTLLKPHCLPYGSGLSHCCTQLEPFQVASALENLQAVVF